MFVQFEHRIGNSSIMVFLGKANAHHGPTPNESRLDMYVTQPQLGTGVDSQFLPRLLVMVLNEGKRLCFENEHVS